MSDTPEYMADSKAVEEAAAELNAKLAADAAEECAAVEKKLREIFDVLQSASSNYQRGFLEGRGLEVTANMERHPEFWEGKPCWCGECQDACADYA